MIRLDSCADKHGFLTRMAKSIPTNSAAMKPIGTGARQAFAELEHWLYSHPSAAQRLHLIEAEQQRRGREVLRLMLQAHIDSRGDGGVGEVLAVLPEGSKHEISYGHKRSHAWNLLEEIGRAHV